ncbi:hypothetical protein HNQ51_002341 [Inhella inkyongensis]|uniref:DUF6036 domain-containing protein n=1 Tax=Inhella inkyongensis TaxID=392593 RepID=A0A840S616_9BURK|nr:DUF6036 family nucleotidyltransferase [Inhella inkyongensis]MBB5205022.1 hypothetical protein [Inhella inkyongensis]
MTREQLEHIIRAAGRITNQYEFMVIGSQSILGAVPNAPADLTVSMEADIYPWTEPALGDAIEGAIGEGSDFHTTHGYYAQAVDASTADLPSGWQTRLHRIQNANTDDRVAYCLDLPDLFLAKASAGRPKDRAFCTLLFVHRLLSLDAVLTLLPNLPVDADKQARLRRLVNAWFKEAERRNAPA